MDLRFTAAEDAFRAEVDRFFDTDLPADLLARSRAGIPPSRTEYETWRKALVARGWYAPGWPTEHGGAGWSPVQRHIFDEVSYARGGLRTPPFGVNMLGPVLLKYGTEAQKNTLLPRILSGEDWWCQGYSEPNAGSDLASLQTAARRDGDDYIVNGQKTWTSLAQYANRIFCLVRTSREGRRQEGISFLLIDMGAAGVERRPIRTLDGGEEINEIFLRDVRVPAANLVGEENRGWEIAKYLLGHERTGIAGVGEASAGLAALRRIAAAEEKDGRPLAEDPVFARRIALLEVELEALKTTNLRLLAGGIATGAAPSMLKVKGTEIRRRIWELTRQALGPEAAFDRRDPAAPPRLEDWATARAFNMRKISIYGGSNEIQRDIIARDLLGG